MIHPLFKNVPDQYVGEVLSEAMEPGEYKYAYTIDGSEFTREDGFPPEPSALTSISAAFVARNGRDVSRFVIHGFSGKDFEPKSKRIIEAYEKTIVTHQDVAKTIEPDAHMLGIQEAHPKFGKLGQWAIDATQNDNKRLIAAHLVFVARRGRLTHDALAFPTAIKNEFPLLVRDSVSPLMFEDNLDWNEIGNEESEQPMDIQAYLGSFMRNDESTQVLANLPPSMVMPPLKDFRAALRMHTARR